jgi:transposase
LRERAPELERVVLESGALSSWLCTGLAEQGLPAVCIDARAAHGALKQRRDKTDRSDAEGLARAGARDAPGDRCVAGGAG